MQVSIFPSKNLWRRHFTTLSKGQKKLLFSRNHQEPNESTLRKDSELKILFLSFSKVLFWKVSSESSEKPLLKLIIFLNLEFLSIQPKNFLFGI